MLLIDILFLFFYQDFFDEKFLYIILNKLMIINYGKLIKL